MIGTVSGGGGGDHYVNGWDRTEGRVVEVAFTCPSNSKGSSAEGGCKLLAQHSLLGLD